MASYGAPTLEDIVQGLSDPQAETSVAGVVDSTPSSEPEVVDSFKLQDLDQDISVVLATLDNMDTQEYFNDIIDLDMVVEAEDLLLLPARIQENGDGGQQGDDNAPQVNPEQGNPTKVAPSKPVPRRAAHKPRHHCQYDGCSASYIRGYDLSYHEKDVHSPDAKEALKCDWPGCTKTYASKYALKSHKDIKHEKKFAKLCELCGKKYAPSDSLKQHITVPYP